MPSRIHKQAGSALHPPHATGNQPAHSYYSNNRSSAVSFTHLPTPTYISSMQTGRQLYYGEYPQQLAVPFQGISTEHAASREQLRYINARSDQKLNKGCNESPGYEYVKSPGSAFQVLLPSSQASALSKLDRYDDTEVKATMSPPGYSSQQQQQQQKMLPLVPEYRNFGLDHPDFVHPSMILVDKQSTLRNIYDSLIYCQQFADTVPLNHIRVWKARPGNTYFSAGEIVYDCVCDFRKPGSDLRRIKRHVYKHNSDNYMCSTCYRIFTNHWSFNAHQKTHVKTDTLSSDSPSRGLSSCTSHGLRIIKRSGECER